MSKTYNTCRMHACPLHVCACMGTDQVNREKTRCQLQKWSCPVGVGDAGRLPARAGSRQCAFLKTLRRAGLGEWLFKTLGSFYFTTMEVNSVLKCQSKWSHLASAHSLCVSAVEVRLDESQRAHLSSFLQLKLTAKGFGVWASGTFFLWKDIEVYWVLVWLLHDWNGNSAQNAIKSQSEEQMRLSPSKGLAGIKHSMAFFVKWIPKTPVFLSLCPLRSSPLLQMALKHSFI